MYNHEWVIEAETRYRQEAWERDAHTANLIAEALRTSRQGWHCADSRPVAPRVPLRDIIALVLSALCALARHVPRFGSPQLCHCDCDGSLSG